MRLSNTVAATVFASILFSASASSADEGAAPQPGATPQPLPGPKQEQPLRGYVPPPSYYPPPYYVSPDLLARPGCRPTWENPCRGSDYLPPAPVAPPVLVAPRILDWSESDQIPPGYRKRTVRRTGLVIGGSITFGTAWVPSAIVGSFGAYELTIPVVGPFIFFSRLLHTDGGPGLIGVMLVFDGLQQAAGVAMLIAGIAAPKTILLRADVKAAKRWWLPTPMSLGKGSAGLGIVGTM